MSTTSTTMNTTLNNLKGKLSPTAIVNYFGGNRGSMTDEIDDPPPIQLSQQSPLTQPDPEKANDNKAKGGTKGRSTRTFDCPECDSKVKKLIECEFCRKWMCMSCADLSNEACKIANDWQHALHFYCKQCFPKLNNLILNHQSFSDVNESLNTVNNKIESLSQQLALQLQDLPKIASLLKSNSEASRTKIQVAPQLSTAPSNPAPSITKQIEAVSIIDEFTEREKRKNNIVLSNIPEPTGDNREDRSAHDLATVKSIINEFKIQGVQIIRTVRLGKFNPLNTRGRLVLAELADNSVKGRLLTTASKARQNSQLWKNIYISPDLTPQQRLEGKQLRDELRRRRDNGERNLIIRHNKIVRDPKSQMPQNNPQPSASSSSNGNGPTLNLQKATTATVLNTTHASQAQPQLAKTHPLQTRENGIPTNSTTPPQPGDVSAEPQAQTGTSTPQTPPLDNTDTA